MWRVQSIRSYAVRERGGSQTQKGLASTASHLDIILGRPSKAGSDVILFMNQKKTFPYVSSQWEARNDVILFIIPKDLILYQQGKQEMAK